MLMATLFGMLVVVSIYFFAKSSTNAEKGYLLKENQLRQKELESQHRILEQQVLDAQSIGKLEKTATVKEMEPPVSTIYVKPRGPLTQRR